MDIARWTVEELRAEVERLTAGADQTPVPEGVVMTPGQLLHRLNTVPGDKRLEMAERILTAMGEASMCFQVAHKEHIDELQDRLFRGRQLACWLIAELRWIATHPEEFLMQRKAGVR